ncbi:MAG: glycoside hydrolase family 16 protein [Colwellia sp.]
MKQCIILLLTFILSACGSSGGSNKIQELALVPAPEPDSTADICGPADQEVAITEGGDWTLVWSDEFDGEVIDTSKWQHEVNCAGGGNDELQCYVDDRKNSFIENGNLHIKALNEVISGDAGWSGNSGDIVERDYSSARVRTVHQGDWRYGRIETRAKLPYGQGIWPAIWTLPTENVYGNWPYSGEIDIMEVVNLETGADDNHLFATLHYTNEDGNLKSSGNGIYPETSMSQQFHIYTIEWEAGEIRWYIDDTHYATQRQTGWMTCGGAIKEGFTKTDSAPFDQKVHLILNLAIGGNWPGDPNSSTIFPQEMLIDYVRVYECSVDPMNGHGCATVDPNAELVR